MEQDFKLTDFVPKHSYISSFNMALQSYTTRATPASTKFATLASVLAATTATAVAFNQNQTSLAAQCGALPVHGVPGTNQERTFLAVKPDGVQRGLVGDIIARFEKRGYKVRRSTGNWQLFC